MKILILALIMERCSALFLYFGFLRWKRERIDIMHDYRIKNIKERDKKAYTTIMGKSIVVIVIGLAVSGIIGSFTDSAKRGIPFGDAFILGLCMMLHAQIKYNYGILGNI